MRTDGVQIGKDSVVAIRESINNIFGGDFLPLNPIEYSNNVANAQEAHEAIRPTDPKKSPESIENNIGKDEYELYSLIWKRTLSSQMRKWEGVIVFKNFQY